VALDYLDSKIDLNDPRTAAVYDELPLWSATFGLLLLQHLPLRPGVTVLDVGCGTGFPTLELAQRLGASSMVYAIDPWGRALVRAKEKAKRWGVRNARFRQGDAGAMPFGDAMFDLVVSNLGINNFDSPRKVLAECRRVLKRSGRLALTTNLQGHMKEFYSVFEETIRDVGSPGASSALLEHVRHRATVAELRSLLEGTGFRLTKVRRAKATMRFADGSALFRHYFVKLGFLDDWKRVVLPGSRGRVFSRLERKLNRLARSRGELLLTIPIAYVEAGKAG
jgi:arsenite methyltransferase